MKKNSAGWISMIAGIDFGSKKAGTTALCIGSEEGKFKEISCSIKGKDADAFLIGKIEQYSVSSIFIDAPLSLPGALLRVDGYSDYFYRQCDRETGAMSPMFLGGLTARAIKLKDYWEHKSIKVFEVWPSGIARELGLSSDIYKSSKQSLGRAGDYINQWGYTSSDYNFNSWHEIDALLAYISGLRVLRKEAMIFGAEEEGIIYI